MIHGRNNSRSTHRGAKQYDPKRGSRPNEAPLARAENLSVRLSGIDILSRLSFRVECGRLTGLLGPNGSGKTTLLRSVSGIQQSSGTLEVLGRSIASWRPRDLARRLAFVRQSASMSFDFRVSELVLLGRSPHKGWLQDYSREDLHIMKHALDLVDLTPLEDRSVHTLSGGELQRAFLAQALVQEAEVLLLDEPTAHLDVHYQFEFMELIQDFVKQGRSAVVVFHDLEIAARYADELIVLDRGRLAATGPPIDVLTRDLIADVFRMEARLYESARSSIRIEYVAPVARQSLVSQSR